MSQEERPAQEPALAFSRLNFSSYLPLWCSCFGALCFGGGLDLCCCGGGLDRCCGAGWEVFSRGGFDAGLPCCWYVGLAADPLFWLPAEPLFCELFGEPFVELGFVNGRNPPSELPLFAGVEFTRASLGDIAGAWYSPPADRAGTAECPLKSPGLAVAAIAGRT